MCKIGGCSNWRFCSGETDHILSAWLRFGSGGVTGKTRIHLGPTVIRRAYVPRLFGSLQQVGKVLTGEPIGISPIQESYQAHSVVLHGLAENMRQQPADIAICSSRGLRISARNVAKSRIDRSRLCSQSIQNPNRKGSRVGPVFVGR